MKSLSYLFIAAAALASVAVPAETIVDQVGNDITLVKTEDLGRNIDMTIQPSDCVEASRREEQHYDAIELNCVEALQSRLHLPLIGRETTLGATAPRGKSASRFAYQGSAPLVKIYVAVRRASLQASQAVGFYRNTGGWVSFFDSKGNVRHEGDRILKDGTAAAVLSFAAIVQRGGFADGPIFSLGFKPFIDFPGNGEIFRTWDDGISENYYITNFDTFTYERSDRLKMIDRSTELFR